MLGADVLMGHDPNCARWIRKFRELRRAAGAGRATSRPTRSARAARSPRARRHAAERRPSRGWTARSPGGSIEELDRQRQGSRSSSSCRPGKRGRFPLGTPCSQAARSLGVDIDSVCGGRGICGRCQVEVAEGDFAKHGVTSARATISRPFGAIEKRYAERRGLPAGRRLSLLGPARRRRRHRRARRSSQVHQARSCASGAETRDDRARSAWSGSTMSRSTSPTCTSRPAISQRLEQALARAMGHERTSTAICASCQQLQKALRTGRLEGHRRRPLRGRADHRRSGRASTNKAYGLAVDIGSTTIAGHLCDLSSGEVVASAGLMNPQIRFGEDLMSRVSLCDDEPRRRRAR